MPVAVAGSNQTYAYSVPRTITLSGSGTGGTIAAYQWYFLSKPAGSTATLSSSTASGPTFSADLPGSYLLFLKVQDSLGAWSETNPLKATSGAFVLITIRSSSLDISMPAIGQRNWGAILQDAINKLEAPIGVASAHVGAGTGKHSDSQITYSRSDGSRKNITGSEDDVLSAINRLDDTIAAITGLTTTDKTSVVAAINEVRATVVAAVSTSAGVGDAGKLAKLTGAGILDSTLHGAQTSGSLHAAAIAGGASGFMTGADKTKLDGIEALADVTDETNVLAALAASTAAKNMGGGKVTNLANPAAVGDAVPLYAVVHGALGIFGRWCPDGQQPIAIENAEVLADGDLVELRPGARVRKAQVGATNIIGVCRQGGTGDAGGTVLAYVQDRGIYATLIVENGQATTVGSRVALSGTANQIKTAAAVNGSFGIALETVAGNGVLTCEVYLQPFGMI